MNHLTISGFIGSPPRTKRYSQSGKAVCSIPLAVNNGKDKPPGWLTLIGWEWNADKIESLTKGDLVVASGRLQIRSYEKKDGSQGNSTELVCESIDKVMRADKVKTYRAPEGEKQSNEQTFGDTAVYPSSQLTDDDIPF